MGLKHFMNISNPYQIGLKHFMNISNIYQIGLAILR